MRAREDIVRALRCSASTGDKDCTGCPYRIRGEFEGFTWESCDCDRMAVDAADMLEKDETYSGVLQDAVEKWKKAYGTLRGKHNALLEQNGKLRDAAADVTRLAAEAAVERDWIRVEDRLPEDDGDVLAIVSGYPTPNITLEDVLVVAAFCEGEGWYIEEYPDWDNPIITYWMPLPEPPEEGK